MLWGIASGQVRSGCCSPSSENSPTEGMLGTCDQEVAHLERSQERVVYGSPELLA